MSCACLLRAFKKHPSSATRSSNNLPEAFLAQHTPLFSFRASIARYFPLAPSCWQVFGGQRAEPPPAWWDSLGAAVEKAVAKETATVDA